MMLINQNKALMDTFDVIFAFGTIVVLLFLTNVLLFSHGNEKWIIIVQKYGDSNFSFMEIYSNTKVPN